MSAMKNKFKYLIIASLLILTVGCSSSYDKSTRYESMPQISEAPAAEEYYEDSFEAEMSSDGSHTVRPTKIIVEANIGLETKHFDRDTDAIKDIVSDGKIYFENTSLTTKIYNDEEHRVFYAKLRVATEEYERVKAILTEIGNLKRINETTEDVTSRYYDSQARLETKKIEEARVLELIDQAENVEDIIELESQLADIRLEIELYTDDISNIDKLTSYSTIYLEICEVNDYSLKYISGDLGSELLNGLNKSYHVTVSIAQGIAIVFAGLIVPAIILAVLRAVVLVILSFVGRLKHKQKTK